MSEPICYNPDNVKLSLKQRNVLRNGIGNFFAAPECQGGCGVHRMLAFIDSMLKPEDLLKVKGERRMIENARKQRVA